MGLCIPHPGHFEALEEIIKSSGKEIYEIYMNGCPDYIGSVRRILESSPTMEDIAEQTKFVHEHGIKMNVLSNSSCLGGQHLTDQGNKTYRWYLEKLNDIGVDSITVADPYLVEMISRDFDIEVVVSCISFVDSPEKAVYYEQLGAETITLDSNINKHFDLLEGIRDATSCNLRIMVNEGCLYRCPFRYAHFNLTSHYFGPGPRLNTIGDYYHDKCVSMRIENPELIMRSGWIRPEDMKEYEKIGIDLFKIAGRVQPVNWIINCTQAYVNRSYDGNLMDILDGTGALRHLFYIPNKELDGAIEKWKKCDKFCHKCSFCKELVDKAVKIYSRKGTERENLKSFCSLKSVVSNELV